MLGGTTLTIESEASRMATAAIGDSSKEIGICPSCNAPSGAHMTQTASSSHLVIP